MTDHIFADVTRLIIGVTALWLAVLIIRYGWARRAEFRNGGGQPHVLFYVSYFLVMVLLAALRLSHVGDAPTWDLWVAAVIDACGVAGACFMYRLPRSKRGKVRRDAADNVRNG